MFCADDISVLYDGVMSVKERYTIYCGDARRQLRNVESDSVQICCTSPPYYGLRDYGTAKWIGGDHDCSHVRHAHAGHASTLNGGKGGGAKLGATVMPYGNVCGKCGAKRIDRQIGIEDSPQAYIDNLVAVFEEVRRVLRPDGTCWINIGDSYSSGGRKTTQQVQTISAENVKSNLMGFRPRPREGDGIKPKDLLGIPWALAFALRDAGWYLRQDIIWRKRNCLPESVTDRCTQIT